jgi:hypothetical protein
MKTLIWEPLTLLNAADRVKVMGIETLMELRNNSYCFALLSKPRGAQVTPNPEPEERGDCQS